MHPRDSCACCKLLNNHMRNELGCSAICSAYEKNLRALFFSSKPMRGDLMASMSVAGTFCTTFLLSTKLPSTALNSKYFVTSATEKMFV